jgi:hypothetical protein
VKGWVDPRYSVALIVVLLLFGLLYVPSAAVPKTFPGGLRLSADPPPPLLVSITPNNTTIDLGQNLSLHANASGGSGNPADWSFTWNDLPTGCTSTSTANYTCTPSLNGTWNVSVEVRDSSSHQVNTSANASVTINLDVAIVEFTSSVGSNVTSGYNYTLSVLVTNGTPPYGYSYTGLPTGCTGTTTPSVGCTAGTPGNYSFTVVVTDATGDTNSSTLNLTVTPVSTVTTPPPTKTVSKSGGVTDTTYGEMAGILVVGALIAMALLVKARRDDRQTFMATPRTAPPTGAGATTSPFPPSAPSLPSTGAPPPGETGSSEMTPKSGGGEG